MVDFLSSPTCQADNNPERDAPACIAVTISPHAQGLTIFMACQRIIRAAAGRPQ
jgi:hypothetical protein